MSGAMQRPPAPQPYYPPPPSQYYQPQPSYQDSEARRRYLAHQAEIKRQKAEQAEQEKAKQQKEQEQAKLNPTPASGGSSTFTVNMTRKEGNLWVPVQINGAVAIDFVVDSGASLVTIPLDVFNTLRRSGTISDDDIIAKEKASIADGSEVTTYRFRLHKLQVGDKVLADVEASLMPKDSATPLLGLTFLSRFKSWTIDNNSGTLALTLPDEAPTQIASAGATPVSASSAAAPTPQKTDTMPAPQHAETAPQPTPDTTMGTPVNAQPHPAQSGQSVAQATEATAAKPAAAEQAPNKPQTPAPTLVASATPNPAPVPPAVSDVPTFPANTAYSDARHSLMALGYEPAPLPDADKCDRNTDKTCFPEREACTSDNGTQCEFFWKRGERLIKVTTTAIPPTVSTVGCQVNCQ